ncbi:DUF1566 domain-containing protein [Vibrio algivorus]|uniref:DUF1566 domain-containing protein n=2 Tax=Vibrio algivorus TaxID=1667024 RepID=A0A557PGY5_9VIBR|nr:DUF1566 domain-containing protein [Vibrio algivorus]
MFSSDSSIVDGGGDGSGGDGSGGDGSGGDGSGGDGVCDGDIDHIDIMEINPPTGTPGGITQIPIDAQLQYQAKLYCADGSPAKDVTTSATWESEAPAIATINEAGVAKGVAVGATNIHAEYADVNSNALSLNVTDATLVSVTLDGRQVTLVGLPVDDLTATALYSDDTKQVVNAFSDWESSNETVATVDDIGVLTPISSGSTDITSTYWGIASNALMEVVINPTDITNIHLDIFDSETYLATPDSPPDDVSISQDASNQLYAVLKVDTIDTAPEFPDVDISTYVTWLSDNTNTVSVSETGLATGIQVSTDTSVTASIDVAETSLSDDIIVNVIPADLGPTVCGSRVDDADPENAKGACLKVATDADGNWFTSTPSINVMNTMAYIVNNTKTNTGDTYAETYSEDGTYGPADGEFAQFRQDGENVISPGGDDDTNAGINGQFDRWCQKLASIEFAGKSNWRRPRRDELEAFYQKYDGEGAEKEGLWSARGWPTYYGYWSSTANVSSYYYMVLNDGLVSSDYPSGERYASCVSNP